jgi:hypothetical protein
MIGRAAYNDPWGVLGDADRAVFGEEVNGARSRREVLEQYCDYADAMLGRWGGMTTEFAIVYFNNLTRGETERKKEIMKERKKELHKVQLRVQLRKPSVCACTNLYASTPGELPP